MMTQPLSSYEKLRLENLRQNQKILAELGLRPVGDVSLDADNRSDKENGSKQMDSGTGYAARKSIHNASTALLKKRRRTTATTASIASPSVDSELRRSTRLVGKTAKYSYEDLVDVDEVLGLRRRSGRPRSGVTCDSQVSSVNGSHVRLDESTYTYRRSDKPLEKKYGVIDNVPVGTLFQSRMECCYAGIHGPTVAGIHPGSEVMFIYL
uniref:YDG domain-containing protein n=1 Tax=Romanomermis culicivorax TaxID=13658 RepID=A0A915JUZ7_ROMCU